VKEMKVFQRLKVLHRFIRKPRITRMFLAYFCLFELMVIGVLISIIESHAFLIWEAPTVGLTIFLLALVGMMFLKAATSV
jgi:hypothetical protein